MTEVKKAVKQFKKLLHRQPLSFETVADIAKTKGYSTSFYDVNKEDELMNKYNLAEHAKTVDAFTFRRCDYRIIFINSNVPPEDKLYLLLHEAGHVFMPHLVTNKLTVNTRLQDIEADAFAYAVLTSCKRTY